MKIVVIGGTGLIGSKLLGSAHGSRFAMEWHEAGGGMLNLQSGDRIELFYEDAPATKIRATVGRLLTDRDEGMGSEVEDYAACWIEITVDAPRDMDANQVVLLGTDFQYRLNGRPVTIRKSATSSSGVLGT